MSSIVSTGWQPSWQLSPGQSDKRWKRHSTNEQQDTIDGIGDGCAERPRLGHMCLRGELPSCFRLYDDPHLRMKYVEWVCCRLVTLPDSLGLNIRHWTNPFNLVVSRLPRDITWHSAWMLCGTFLKKLQNQSTRRAKLLRERSYRENALECMKSRTQALTIEHQSPKHLPFEGYWTNNRIASQFSWRSLSCWCATPMLGTVQQSGLLFFGFPQTAVWTKQSPICCYSNVHVNVVFIN